MDENAQTGARKGATTGVFIAVFTILMAITGAHEALGLESAIYYFAATPLFAFNVVSDAPALIQWLLLIFWWLSIGGAVGWSVSKAEGGLYVASVLIVLTVAGHLQTVSDVELDLSGNLRGVSSALENMMIGN